MYVSWTYPLLPYARNLLGVLILCGNSLRIFCFFYRTFAWKVTVGKGSDHNFGLGQRGVGGGTLVDVWGGEGRR